jgi:mono/diheme cytochrome c family protein
MNRMLLRCVAGLVTLLPFIVVSWVEAQQNGEAHSTVPTVVRTVYDMRTFIAPLPLNETESKGRAVFAQRCANCHGGSAQRPGPSLGQQTIQRLGDAAIREKVGKGSQMMPAFAYTLEPAQVDQIIAFLKIAPARAPAAPLDETAP